MLANRPTDLAGISEDDPSVAHYYNPVKSGKDSWSNFYTNDNGRDVVSYAMPLIVNGETIGVIGADMLTPQLNEMIEDISIYGTGYAFLMDENLNYLLHPQFDESVNLRDVGDGAYNNDIADTVESEENGLIDFNFNNESRIVSFTKLHDGNILFLTADTAEIFAEINTTIFMIIAVIALVSIVGGLISVYVGRNIAKPIVYATEVIERTAELDLTTSGIEDSEEWQSMIEGQDESGIMLRSMGVLRKEMRDIIGAIEETSEEVVRNTEELTVATNETSQSIGEVSYTVEEMADAGMDLATNTETGLNRLTRLSDEIYSAVENGEQVVVTSQNAQDINKEGSEAMVSMVEVFKLVNESSEILSNNIDMLSENSNSIGGILTTIIEIAEQTNLLALNAAIEAARAGEEGRGFAVVANEIRSLAEETGNATEDIEKILNTIQEEVEETKQNMDNSNSAVEEANESLESASSAFQQINSAMDLSIESIEELQSRLQAVERDKNEVMQVIENMSAVAEESAASTEELSASMEEQSAMMDTISSNTDNLSNRIIGLNELINRFKL